MLRDADGKRPIVDRAEQGLEIVADQKQCMISFAVKLTRSAATVGAEDVSRLRDGGLSDAAIHDLAAVTAYFNFVNRIALGLGVLLEPPASPAE